MVDIVTRSGKGAPLTNTEMDANFSNLNEGLEATRTDVSDLQFDSATKAYARRMAKKAAIKYGG